LSPAKGRSASSNQTGGAMSRCGFSSTGFFQPVFSLAAIRQEAECPAAGLSSEALPQIPGAVFHWRRGRRLSRVLCASVRGRSGSLTRNAASSLQSALTKKRLGNLFTICTYQFAGLKLFWNEHLQKKGGGVGGRRGPRQALILSSAKGQGSEFDSPFGRD
jgi:hypothetical protein